MVDVYAGYTDYPDGMHTFLLKIIEEGM